MHIHSPVLIELNRLEEETGPNQFFFNKLTNQYFANEENKQEVEIRDYGGSNRVIRESLSEVMLPLRTNKV